MVHPSKHNQNLRNYHLKNAQITNGKENGLDEQYDMANIQQTNNWGDR